MFRCTFFDVVVHIRETDHFRYPIFFWNCRITHCGLWRRFEFILSSFGPWVNKRIFNFSSSSYQCILLCSWSKWKLLAFSRLLDVNLSSRLIYFSLATSWTINTQYYTADVSVSVAHLHEEFSIEALPMFNQLAALVMVFDMNDVSPFYFASFHFVSSLISCLLRI